MRLNNNKRSKAIMVDIDGTLANIDHRVHFVIQKPKDWKSFYAGIKDDKINQWCLDIIENFEQSHFVILLTGRDESQREATVEWLERQGVYYDILLMRPKGDRREDFVVKPEIYESRIKPDFEVSFVVEDRTNVVKAWRSLGLTCLQCADGNF